MASLICPCNGRRLCMQCLHICVFVIESRPLMERAFDGFIKLLWFRLAERQGDA